MVFQFKMRIMELPIEIEWEKMYRAGLYAIIIFLWVQSEEKYIL
jgi:hypothetical protein